MLELAISASFVRSLAKEMRHRLGKDSVSHTAAIEIVASALGWKPDALMHKLKNDEKVPRVRAPGRPVISLPPDEIEDQVIEDWRVLRYWQNIERAFVDLMRRRHDGSFRHSKQVPDWDLVTTILSICRIALGDAAGALKVLSEVKNDTPRIRLVKAIALIESGDHSKTTYAMISDALAKRPEMMRNIRVVRDPYIREFANGMVRVINGQFEVENDAELTKLYSLPHRDAIAIASKNGRCFVENDLDSDIAFMIEHLPKSDGIHAILRTAREDGYDISQQVKESVTENAIICLYNGCARVMMKHYLRAAYGKTPEEYRQFWGLPDDYPMIAPKYAREKADIARGGVAAPEDNH